MVWYQDIIGFFQGIFKTSVSTTYRVVDYVQNAVAPIMNKALTTVYHGWMQVQDTIKEVKDYNEDEDDDSNDVVDVIVDRVISIIKQKIEDYFSITLDVDSFLASIKSNILNAFKFTDFIGDIKDTIASHLGIESFDITHLWDWLKSKVGV